MPPPPQRAHRCPDPDPAPNPAFAQVRISHGVFTTGSEGAEEKLKELEDELKELGEKLEAAHAHKGHAAATATLAPPDDCAEVSCSLVSSSTRSAERLSIPERITEVPDELERERGSSIGQSRV